MPYAVSRLACEHYIKAFQKQGDVGSYTLLRFFGAYGPHEPSRKIYTRLAQALALEKQDEFEAWVSRLELDQPEKFLVRLRNVVDVLVQDDWWIDREAVHAELPVN